MVEQHLFPFLQGKVGGQERWPPRPPTAETKAVPAFKHGISMYVFIQNILIGFTNPEAWYDRRPTTLATDGAAKE